MTDGLQALDENTMSVGICAGRGSSHCDGQDAGHPPVMGRKGRGTKSDPSDPLPPTPQGSIPSRPHLLEFIESPRTVSPAAEQSFSNKPVGDRLYSNHRSEIFQMLRT